MGGIAGSEHEAGGIRALMRPVSSVPLHCAGRWWKDDMQLDEDFRHLGEN